MANADFHQKPRIAISGGGLAGAAITNALINIPHLEVHVYESAPEFSERGAAVGLAINAQRALETIVPSAADLLSRAGAVSMNSTRLVVVRVVQTLLVLQADESDLGIWSKCRESGI